LRSRAKGTFNAAWADVRASVFWLSRARTLNALESSVENHTEQNKHYRRRYQQFDEREAGFNFSTLFFS